MSQDQVSSRGTRVSFPIIPPGHETNYPSSAGHHTRIRNQILRPSSDVWTRQSTGSTVVITPATSNDSAVPTARFLPAEKHSWGAETDGMKLAIKPPGVKTGYSNLFFTPNAEWTGPFGGVPSLNYSSLEDQRAAKAILTMANAQQPLHAPRMVDVPQHDPWLICYQDPETRKVTVMMNNGIQTKLRDGTSALIHHSMELRASSSLPPNLRTVIKYFGYQPAGVSPVSENAKKLLARVQIVDNGAQRGMNVGFHPRELLAALETDTPSAADHEVARFVDGFTNPEHVQSIEKQLSEGAVLFLRKTREGSWLKPLWSHMRW